jgi:hypothetical protein
MVYRQVKKGKVNRYVPAEPEYQGPLYVKKGKRYVILSGGK